MQIRLAPVLQLTSGEAFEVDAALESQKKSKTNVLNPTEFKILHTFSCISTLEFVHTQYFISTVLHNYE